jgi:hypothetical protein
VPFERGIINGLPYSLAQGHYRARCNR